MSVAADMDAARLAGMVRKREAVDRESAARDVLVEAASSRLVWPAYHTHHEAYGVLCEEVAEYFDEVRRREDGRDREALRNELKQIAAVAIRAMVEL